MINKIAERRYILSQQMLEDLFYYTQALNTHKESHNLLMIYLKHMGFLKGMAENWDNESVRDANKMAIAHMFTVTASYWETFCRNSAKINSCVDAQLLETEEIMRTW